MKQISGILAFIWIQTLNILPVQSPDSCNIDRYTMEILHECIDYYKRRRLCCTNLFTVNILLAFKISIYSEVPNNFEGSEFFCNKVGEGGS